MIQMGLETIAKNVYPGLETVVFCGFTPQEQAELSDIAKAIAYGRRRWASGGCVRVAVTHLLTLMIRFKTFRCPRSPVGWRTR